jgi:hypothetical protein
VGDDRILSGMSEGAEALDGGNGGQPRRTVKVTLSAGAPNGENIGNFPKLGSNATLIVLAPVSPEPSCYTHLGNFLRAAPAGQVDPPSPRLRRTGRGGDDAAARHRIAAVAEHGGHGCILAPSAAGLAAEVLQAPGLCGGWLIGVSEDALACSGASMTAADCKRSHGWDGFAFELERGLGWLLYEVRR